MVTQVVALGPEFDHLPDDTEETLGGATSHQDSINLLYDSLILCGPDRGLPWLVGNQLMLLIPRQVGRSYNPSPDIMVHPTLGDVERTSLNVAIDGPPVLIVEVASPSTSPSSDLNLDSPSGKPGAYAAIGVLEYLVFDPTGQMIGEPEKPGPTPVASTFGPETRTRIRGACWPFAAWPTTSTISTSNESIR